MGIAKCEYKDRLNNIISQDVAGHIPDMESGEVFFFDDFGATNLSPYAGTLRCSGENGRYVVFLEPIE